MTQTTAPAPARTEVTGAQVQTAVRTFAQALAESPAFQAFEQAADRFRQDEAAQAAFQAYRAKQQSLQTMLMLNAVGSEEQAELKRLYQAFKRHILIAVGRQGHLAHPRQEFAERWITR